MNDLSDAMDAEAVNTSSQDTIEDSSTSQSGPLPLLPDTGGMNGQKTVFLPPAFQNKEDNPESDMQRVAGEHYNDSDDDNDELGEGGAGLILDASELAIREGGPPSDPPDADKAVETPPPAPAPPTPPHPMATYNVTVPGGAVKGNMFHIQLADARIHSVTHSLTRSLTHSRTQSLTHSFTDSLTHSLTRSLNHSIN